MSKTADDYIGASLYAVAPVNTYKGDLTTVVKKYSKGAYLGTIYSYILKNGFVYWQLNDNTFVKHNSSDLRVDESTTYSAIKEQQKAEQEKAYSETVTGKIENAGKAVVDATTKTVKGVGDAVGGLGTTLSNVGNNFTIILAIVAVLALAIGIWYLSKTAKAIS